MIIAIDGPAASGKSTIAKRVALNLGLDYLDTGAMYRAVTFKALDKSLNTEDAVLMGRLARDLSLEFKNKTQGDNICIEVFLDGQDISEEIRSPRVTASVSAVAKIPEVRMAMVELQRRLAGEKDTVAEGRDVGTQVFPKAEKKFFLVASARERATRRCKEFEEKGYQVDIDSLERDIASRDAIDSARENSPLRRADDAILIDTTRKSIEDVVTEILEHIGRKV
ncbi:MAG: (d)CMP kinase [Actinomycetota bacterium]|nr:(d)CMP kinase [Actinomycetota bacterium]